MSLILSLRNGTESFGKHVRQKTDEKVGLENIGKKRKVIWDRYDRMVKGFVFERRNLKYKQGWGMILTEE